MVVMQVQEDLASGKEAYSKDDIWYIAFFWDDLQSVDSLGIAYNLIYFCWAILLNLRNVTCIFVILWYFVGKLDSIRMLLSEPHFAKSRLKRIVCVMISDDWNLPSGSSSHCQGQDEPYKTS